MDPMNKGGDDKLGQAIQMLNQALSLLQEFQGEEQGEPQDEEAQAHGGKGLAILIGKGGEEQ